MQIEAGSKSDVYCLVAMHRYISIESWPCWLVYSCCCTCYVHDG